MKKIICFTLSLMLIFSCFAFSSSAADVSKIEEYKAMFVDAAGPEVDGCSIDYVSFSPEGGEGRYPLVIWLHGAGEGAYPRAQIEQNNFALWASDELQSRFAPAGGAFLFAARAHEESTGSWQNAYIEPLKAAIDDFIAQNKDRIDLSRIYIGGFSMGGMMTFKMAASYPDMFAAAFPICPFYAVSDDEIKAIADMPIWLTVSKYDILAGYYTFSKDNWNKICAYTNIPENCRLSLMGTVRFPDGKKTDSNHHAWFAVSNDMFTYEGKDYYNMETKNANGEKIKLEYPDGIISWLSGFTSDYEGQELSSTGIANKNGNTSIDLSVIVRMIKALLNIIPDFFASSLKSIFDAC